MEPVRSPCINVCCLDADRICVGCGRTADEIGEWLRASEPRRLAIRGAADARLKKLQTSQRMVTND